MACIHADCDGSCKFCSPDIPEDIQRIPAKHRTHWQLKSAQGGLHSSGNEYEDPKPTKATCGACANSTQAYGIPKTLRRCQESVDKEHSIVHPKMIACAKFTQIRTW